MDKCQGDKISSQKWNDHKTKHFEVGLRSSKMWSIPHRTTTSYRSQQIMIFFTSSHTSKDQFEVVLVNRKSLSPSTLPSRYLVILHPEIDEPWNLILYSTASLICLSSWTDKCKNYTVKQYATAYTIVRISITIFYLSSD